MLSGQLFFTDFRQKIAPGITGTIRILYQKLGNDLTKLGKLLVAAPDADLQGAGVIQAEHSDKAFSVHLLLFISHQNLKGLYHCQRHKILHLPEGLDADIKLMHQKFLRTVQITFFAL